MNLTFRRSIAILFLGLLSVSLVRADMPQSVSDLKTEGIKAIREGRFDVGNTLLAKAAAESNDPLLQRVATWTRQFEQQREKFQEERHTAYEKAVANVRLLLEKGKEDYTVHAASSAYLLADDKKAFGQEQWVRDIVAGASQRAADYEKSGNWFKAMTLYGDLASLEPASPEWKARLKSATRRVALLALYSPDEVKAIRESETKERESVDAILKAANRDEDTAGASTKPTTKPAHADWNDNDNFRIDWKDSLSGIKYSMLREALTNSFTNYYRDISYRDMTLGGLKSLLALAETKGLEKTFPALSDEAKRKAFVDKINESIQTVAHANAENEKMFMFNTLGLLRFMNQDTVNLPEEVIAREFAEGALGELDLFTSMIWPYDKEEFAKTTQGEFSGVGVQIMTDEDGDLKVVSPLEDSPAYRARPSIKAGDIISHINGKIAKGITVNQAVKAITGPEGSSVTLTILSPDGNSRDYTLRREKIKVASVKGYLHKPGGGWDYYVDPENKIAYLRVTNFTKTTGEELAKAIEDLKSSGAKGMIVDLRYNPGGLLTAARDVCDLFMKEGVIVSTRADRNTPNPPTVLSAQPGDEKSSLPLVVLVNQYSASASEIVSGALKDQKRATIVGERTFGKGSVQMLYPVANNSAYLKLTTSHYYLPSGKCIHREENSTEWGVDPDLSIEMTPKQMRAAIDARQDLDILHDNQEPATQPTTKEVKKDLLASDPQLSAALLMLRLAVVGI